MITVASCYVIIHAYVIARSINIKLAIDKEKCSNDSHREIALMLYRMLSR